jgi:hypothetical protein
VARHWPPERRTSLAMPRPLHACVSHQLDLTSPQSTSRGYKTSPFSFIARTRICHRAPPSAIGAAQCKPPSRWRPHPHKPLSSSLCITKPSRVACWSRWAARSPEPELPRPPPDRHCRARLSANPPSPGASLASSLGHMEASGATHCWAPPVSSPPSEPPRPHRLCVAARRRPPRPILLHQLIAGEPSCSFLPLVYHPVPHLTAGEHAIAVGSRGTKGISVKYLKLPGSYAQKDSSPLLCVGWNL